MTGATSWRDLIAVHPAARKAPSQARDKAICGFATTLHQQLAKTLDDLTRLLGGERHRIAEIPLQKRVALARGYLQALGVGLDDLRPVDGGRP